LGCAGTLVRARIDQQSRGQGEVGNVDLSRPWALRAAISWTVLRKPQGLGL